MRTRCKFLIIIFLGTGLILSCNRKDDDDNPTSTGTFNNLNALLEQMGKRQKLYENIAPVELPDYVTQSNDTMMQKIVSLAALIDSSREKSVFPSFANPSTFTKSLDLQSDGEWEMRCFLENTDYWFCRSEKWENDGKLGMVFTQQNSPDAWLRHLVINGEHSNGYVYDYLPVQNWITLKDLTYSEYTYSTIFFPKPPCGPDILWRFITEVEGEDAWIHYLGEAKSLATHKYTTISYQCDFIEGYHINTMTIMEIKPDDTVIFTTAIYSLNLHDIYKWIVYTCMEDGCWIEIVYNEDGTIKERTQSELCPD